MLRANSSTNICRRSRNGSNATLRNKPLASEFPDHRERFGDRGVAIAGADRLLHASVQVMLQKFSSERIERRLHGSNLRQDVDAIPIFVKHIADAAHLALDAVQPAGDLRFAA